MNGIWDSLTITGKLVLLAAVGVVILVFSFAFRSSAQDGGDDNNGAVIVRSPTAITRTSSNATTTAATATLSTTTSAVAAVSATAAAPTATSEPPSPTAQVIIPPTSTPVIVAPPPPTSTPVPPPPAPSPTATIAAINCVVLATVANPAPIVGSNQTVTGQVSCGGKAVSGVQMAALFSFPSTTATCAGTSDSAGLASCSLRLLEATPNVFVTVNVCFSYQGEAFCGKTGFTPQ
jgi:hypothetical protein